MAKVLERLVLSPIFRNSNQQLYALDSASRSLSKTQLDRLGERLRAGTATETDLRALDSYRRSFWSSYERVVQMIRDNLGLEGTGRPAKTTTAIADKLKRQKTRLSQIQDIAGYRIVVNSVPDQDDALARLTELFPKATIEDRRKRPSHGYRAVHIIVELDERLIEIQLRTANQHQWGTDFRKTC